MLSLGKFALLHENGSLIIWYLALRYPKDLFLRSHFLPSGKGLVDCTFGLHFAFNAEV